MDHTMFNPLSLLYQYVDIISLTDNNTCIFLIHYFLSALIYKNKSFNKFAGNNYFILRKLQKCEEKEG